MKTLETTFKMNADKCGEHTFTQIRRDGNICMYQRNRNTDNRLHSVEVFITKIVKAGSPLPGGGTVTEDYEQYPGASAFGRSAWATNTVQRGNQLFDEIIKENTGTEFVSDTMETVTVPVARVVKNEVKVALKLPDRPFTQKELAAFNEIENYKEVYSDLQKMLNSGVLRVAGQRESTRGKSAKLFAKV